MKYLSLLLVAAALVACSNKAAQPGGSPVTAPTAVEPTMNDNAEVADARSQLVEQIKSQRDATLAKVPAEETEIRGIVSQAYDSAIQKVARQEASSGRELEKFAIAEYQAAKTRVFNGMRERVAAKIIARINPEPKPGEKREAVDSEGNCTNDLVVDMQQFSLKQLDTINDIQTLSQKRGPLASIQIKLAANSLLEKCDEIVDRYDSKAVCKVKLPGEPEEEVKMSEFKESCESTRKQFSKFN